MVDLGSQPLDHAVDLSNLLLGVAQVVPVSACCELQPLILKSRERGREKEREREKMVYMGFHIPTVACLPNEAFNTFGP